MNRAGKGICSTVVRRRGGLDIEQESTWNGEMNTGIIGWELSLHP